MLFTLPCASDLQVEHSSEHPSLIPTETALLHAAKNALGKAGSQPRLVTEVLGEYIPLSGGNIEGMGQMLG